MAVHEDVIELRAQIIAMEKNLKDQFALLATDLEKIKADIGGTGVVQPSAPERLANFSISQIK